VKLLAILLLAALPLAAQEPTTHSRLAWAVLPVAYADLPGQPQPTVRVHLADQTHQWWQPLPVTHRTADWRFDALIATSFAVTAGDVENSLAALRKPGVHEVDPLYGSHPGRARYYAIAMPVTAMCAYYSWRYKREDDALRAAGLPPHKWVKWWLPGALNTGAHVFGILFTLSATGR